MEQVAMTGVSSSSNGTSSSRRSIGRSVRLDGLERIDEEEVEQLE